AAEYRRHRSRDDRRDEASARAETRGLAESERERERDDGYGDARQQVPAGIAPGSGEVGALGEQRDGALPRSAPEIDLSLGARCGHESASAAAISVSSWACVVSTEERVARAARMSSATCGVLSE